MYTITVFRTSDLPGDIGEWFVNQDTFVRDGFTPYTVGDFVKEAAGSPGNYSSHDVTMCGRLDRFLAAFGAADGGRVLVEHG